VIDTGAVALLLAFRAAAALPVAVVEAVVVLVDGAVIKLPVAPIRAVR